MISEQVLDLRNQVHWYLESKIDYFWYHIAITIIKFYYKTINEIINEILLCALIITELDSPVIIMIVIELYYYSNLL